MKVLIVEIEQLVGSIPNESSEELLSDLVSIKPNNATFVLPFFTYIGTLIGTNRWEANFWWPNFVTSSPIIYREACVYIPPFCLLSWLNLSRCVL